MSLEPTIAPAHPFLDWPVVTDPAKWDADVAVLGIPRGEPYPKDPQPNDQARAPDAIRAQSRRFCYSPGNWDFDTGIDPASALPAKRLDLGNVPWITPYDAYSAAVTERVRQLWRRRAQVVILGGDHSVTIPVLDALDAVGEPVHVLQIDAHLDWREEVDGVRRGYSSPLRWASTKAAVSGLTQVGLRGIGSARRQEVEAARAYGSHLITAERVHAEGIDVAIDTIPKGRAVYVTIDADGIDPSEMPAVMAPTAGGLQVRQVAPLLRAVARRNRVVGMDVVEVAPSFDSPNGVTCVTAGRLILNTIVRINPAWGTS